MEVPRFWREMPINTSFSGREKQLDGNGLGVFKYPGGEIMLTGTLDDVYGRFIDKGFTAEATEKILFDLWGAVATKSAISFEEFVDRQNELVGCEVRK